MISATQTFLDLWFQREFPRVHHLKERRNEGSTVFSFPGTHSVPVQRRVQLSKFRQTHELQERVIGLSHSAAMLSLSGIKSFVFARQASPTREFSARLGGQKQSFLFS